MNPATGNDMTAPVAIASRVRLSSALDKASLALNPGIQTAQAPIPKPLTKNIAVVAIRAEVLVEIEGRTLM